MLCSLCLCSSGVMASVECVGGGDCLLPKKKFVMSENCPKILFLMKYFRPKVQNLGLKTQILVKFRGKIEILSTHNLLSVKLAAVCRKIATSYPAYVFNPRRHSLCRQAEVRLSHDMHKKYRTWYIKFHTAIVTLKKFTTAAAAPTTSNFCLTNQFFSDIVPGFMRQNSQELLLQAECLS